ncbi:MAG: heme ABC transporter permease [Alphaproteobacteria bacterium]|nr:heme ABC transporter permease [Alphaproteobacteria bacterium]
MLHYFSSPYRFQKLKKYLSPLSLLMWVSCLILGFYFAFFGSPADYQQGNAVRIMYVHVPSAYMATMIYASMAVAGFVYFIWKHILAEIFVRAAAPVGACFTFICLSTGALWGKPIWGAWWVWDARLTSVLVLFFFYLGYIIFVQNFANRAGRRNALILVMVGAVNLPIVKFSVEWWNSLHQPASLIRKGGPTIDANFLTPLFLMLAMVTFFSIWLILQRMELLSLQEKYNNRHIIKKLKKEVT